MLSEEELRDLKRKWLSNYGEPDNEGWLETALKAQEAATQAEERKRFRELIERFMKQLLEALG